MVINTNRNLLFTAIILALCITFFLHVFLFPLYNASPKQGSFKAFIDFEKHLCVSNYIKPRNWKRQLCPHYGIVTTEQGGRLGNQMWEYASVWAVARRTGLEPYVPSCIRRELDTLFESLSVPTFEEIALCPVNSNKSYVRSLDAWNHTHQSIVLPRWSVLEDVVLTWVQDIIQEFTFRTSLQLKSQHILKSAAKNCPGCVFVGMHVRRTDYLGYLRRKYSTVPANVTFYRRAMKYYEKKYKTVVFIVVSDDRVWCLEHFRRKKNVVVVKKKMSNSASLDLAILASCNHSIIDYGTFGIWGAILAGGETVYYNLTDKYATSRVGQILPKWRVV